MYIFVNPGSTCEAQTPIVGTSEDTSGHHQVTVNVDPAVYPVGQYSAVSYNPNSGISSACESFTVSSPAPVTSAPVGGVVLPADALALLSPWLALLGGLGCIGTVAVIAKKRQP